MPGLGCATLEEIRSLIGDCHRCPLGDTRTTLVFGVGDPHARVVLIGEAPGKNEDLKGEPFVGAAGQLLNELLAEAGLERARRLHRQRAEVSATREPRPRSRSRSRPARPSCASRSA